MVITKLWCTTIWLPRIVRSSPKPHEIHVITSKPKIKPKLLDVGFEKGDVIEQTISPWEDEEGYENYITWSYWVPWSDDSTQDAEAYIKEMESVEGVPTAYIQLLREVKKYLEIGNPPSSEGKLLFEQLKVVDIDAAIERHKEKRNLFNINLRLVGYNACPEVAIKICLTVTDLENNITMKVEVDESQRLDVAHLLHKNAMDLQKDYTTYQKQIQEMESGCEAPLKAQLTTFQNKRDLIDAVVHYYVDKPIDWRYVKNKDGASIAVVFDSFSPWKSWSSTGIHPSSQDYIDLITLNKKVLPPAYLEILKLAGQEKQEELSDSSKAFIKKFSVSDIKAHVVDPWRNEPFLVIAFNIYIEGPRRSKIYLKVENVIEELKSFPIVSVTWGGLLGEHHVLTDDEKENFRHTTEILLRSMVRANDSYLRGVILHHIAE